jgi:hypothetical protein
MTVGHAYMTDMITVTDIDPPMPTAEEMEAYAATQRDNYSGYLEIVRLYNRIEWNEAWAWAIEEYSREHPEWPFRKYFEELG